MTRLGEVGSHFTADSTESIHTSIKTLWDVISAQLETRLPVSTNGPQSRRVGERRGGRREDEFEI